ncbi:MAG: DUF4097 family beta strand repeat protein [Frankiales bacterium]|nr:DUF4097 family beta strand repeat protein [Frankiales bacterium]
MEWTVEQPMAIDIDEPVREVNVRLVAGHVDLVPTDADTARVEVTEIDHDPLIVTIEDGVLTIRHERLSWDGILGWLRTERRRAVVSVAVPIDCAANVGVVSASAVVAGLAGRVSVRCVSGDVVLDEVTGAVEVESVSGDVEGRALDGRLSLKTVSGGLTLVGATGRRVQAHSVSGDMALDLLPDAAPVDVDVTTVSGDVTVRMPGDAGAQVEVSSTSGDLTCSFDGMTLRKRPGSRVLSGSVGDGAGMLHGRTVSGRFALLSR